MHMDIDMHEMADYIYSQLMQMGIHVAENDILLMLDIQLDYFIEMGIAVETEYDEDDGA